MGFVFDWSIEYLIHQKSNKWYFQYNFTKKMKLLVYTLHIGIFKNILGIEFHEYCLINWTLRTIAHPCTRAPPFTIYFKEYCTLWLPPYSSSLDIKYYFLIFVAVWIPKQKKLSLLIWSVCIKAFLIFFLLLRAHYFKILYFHYCILILLLLFLLNNISIYKTYFQFYDIR